ncbi:MAG: FMN-binding protein [Ruminiclostridium sp.]
MKKISAILLIITLAVSMTACSKTDSPGSSTVTPSTTSPSIATTSPSTSTSSQSTSSSSQSTSSNSQAASSSSPAELATKYKDGSYDEKGDPWAQGQEEAVIIIKDGKISNVALMRLDKAGKEIDYSKFDGKVHEGKTYPNLKEFRESLAKKIIEIQSAQVDTISGATVSTGNWKVAAQKALKKASEKK